MDAASIAILVQAAIQASRLYLDFAERAARGELTKEESLREWERVVANVTDANELWERMT